jgi:glycosyltransferase involved in cell wall biosynthesis
MDFALKILIIIPAHNEEQNLPDLLSELIQHSSFFDILLIDDGSTDNTSVSAFNYQLPVIKLNHSGIGAAMQAGFLHALEHGYELVVQIDGDGQHDPRFIHELIRPIIDGRADFVIGSRYIKNNPDGSYKTPLLRRIGMYYSSFMLFFASGRYFTDTTSGFRALNHHILDFFKFNYPVNYPEAGVLFSVLLAGFNIVEIPVTMRPRRSGKSMYNFANIFFYPLHVFIGFIEIYFRAKK